MADSIWLEPRWMMSRLACFPVLLLLSAAVAVAGQPKEGHPIEGLQVGPDTTVVTEPLNALGIPDYVAVVDREMSQGVSPDENFWVLFDSILSNGDFSEAYAQQLSQRPGFEKIRDSNVRFTDLNGKALIAEFDKAAEKPWKNADYPLVAEWLKGNEEALKIVAEAARRPKAYDPLLTSSGDKTLVSVLLPHVQSTRAVARALVARAQLHLGEGHNEEAWQDVMTMHRMTGHLQRSPFLIGRLVGMAISSIAQNSTVICLSDPTLSEVELVDRWTEMASVVHEGIDRTSVIRAERFMALDVALQLRSGAMDLQSTGGYAFGLSDANEPAMFDITQMSQALESQFLQMGDVNEALRYINGFYDEMEKAVAQPTYQARHDSIKQIVKDHGVGEPQNIAGAATAAFLLGGADGLDQLSRSTLIRLFSAAFEAANRAEGRAIARSRLLYATVVAELVRRRSGEDVKNGADLQEAGEALSREHGIPLPALTDPFTDEPFRVANRPTGLLIYSLGDNLQDNGGGTFGEGPGLDDLRVLIPR